MDLRDVCIVHSLMYVCSIYCQSISIKKPIASVRPQMNITDYRFAQIADPTITAQPSFLQLRILVLLFGIGHSTTTAV